MITQNAFDQAIDLLDTVYNTQQEKPVLTSNVLLRNWYSYFCDCFYSDERFIAAVTHYTNVRKFFPRVPGEIMECWQESGLDKSPYLTGIQPTVAPISHQLPDGQARDRNEVESLTAQQKSDNAYRLKLLLMFGMQYKGEDKPQMLEHLKNCSIDEAIAIVRGMKRAETVRKVPIIDQTGKIRPPQEVLFEDMRKYFHSGSERFREMAIEWANKPENGCKIIFEGRKIIDIAQLDF